MKNLILLLMIISASCSKPQQIEIYTVKAGKHHSENRTLSLQPNSLHFDFTVDDSWYWRDGLSKSKVRGLCWIDPKRNSVRLATKIIEGQVNLYMFCHVNRGDPITHHVGIVQKGTHYCQLGYVGSNTFWLRFNDSTYFVDAPDNLIQAELCYPYIGGDYTIDHDWNVKIYSYGKNN